MEQQKIFQPWRREDQTWLPTYWNTPFSKVCLMWVLTARPARYTVINKQASSLQSLIADGNHRPTSLGRDTWKSLIGSHASLQPNCNLEGFNVVSYINIYWPKARIGILAFGGNENCCRMCDYSFGLGTAGLKDDASRLWKALGTRLNMFKTSKGWEISL